jgi:hypothetical protein
MKRTPKIQLENNISKKKWQVVALVFTFCEHTVHGEGDAGKWRGYLVEFERGRRAQDPSRVVGGEEKVLSGRDDFPPLYPLSHISSLLSSCW